VAKVLWKCAAEICSPRLDALNAPALENLGQATDGCFDFGELRHQRSDMAEVRQPR